LATPASRFRADFRSADDPAFARFLLWNSN
jgi:hypothetical protein